MVRQVRTKLSIIMIGLCLVGCLGVGNSENLNDIITLLKENVGEDVIRTHIMNNDMTFNLSTKDIVKLKKAGASDDLIAFMMGSKQDFPFDLAEDFIVKSPVTYQHLAIFPVFRKTPINVAEYITLDQAQKMKVVKITEKASASVPTVIIKNKGNKAIYIMAGEIIIGGKQDRMVSFDIIIPAWKTVEVEVRCVEHGRWHGKSGEFTSGGAVGCKSVRSALQFKAQQDVWEEVAKVCREHDAATGSGTYGAVLSSEEIEDKSKPFIDAMKKGLKDDDMVGLIMALNGEVTCVDIFTNPKYFKEIKEKLIKAYVLDAISIEKSDTSVPGKQEIIAFFEEMRQAQKRELKKYSANSNVELESDDIIGNESRDKDGELQHLNLYRK